MALLDKRRFAWSAPRSVKHEDAERYFAETRLECEMLGEAFLYPRNGGRACTVEALSDWELSEAVGAYLHHKVWAKEWGVEGVPGYLYMGLNVLAEITRRSDGKLRAF